jgi:hypothetical protein
MWDRDRGDLLLDLWADVKEGMVGVKLPGIEVADTRRFSYKH